MILGDKFDRVLWLMLKIDKKDREVVANLIKDIPYELYDKIKNSLSILDKCKNNHDSIKSMEWFHGNCMSDDKLYYYIINPRKGCLSIGMSIKEEDCFNEKIEITLYSVSEEDLFNQKDLMFGSIEFNKNFIYELYLKEKVLSWKSCRYTVVANEYGDIRDINIINVKNIPDELKYEHLSRTNILVREKRKK